MKIRRTASWVLAGAIAAIVSGSASPALAQSGFTGGPPAIPTLSQSGGATMLLPYFEVDLAHTTGRTTRFWINNGSATAILSHVTVWSDLAVPVLAFNVYLTGYDQQLIDMRDIVNGTLPQTASAGQDPSDTISPKGPKSQDINFASCSGTLGSGAISQLPNFNVDYIQKALTGQFTSFVNGCLGRSSPGLARGYVTVDTVNNCTLRFPNAPGYFAPGGSGDATNQNIMWGEYVYINSGTSGQGGHGIPMVQIEASGVDPLTSTSGNYTFYGRLVNFTAADNREPLATNFAARFLRGATAVTVWRDPKMPQDKFACGTTPPWYPLGRERLAFFNEQEQIVISGGSLNSPAPSAGNFAAATQKVKIGAGGLPTPFVSGWIYLDLNTVVTTAGTVPTDTAATQAFVTAIREIRAGAFSNLGAEGGAAFRLDSAANANHSTP
jgi:hypothetical protein